ncbi:MAG: hypothetical protein AVDCRST_MAG93-10038 [uncultured Chloroflexia bacterium]|uniref:Uncharacterized protein n=1 Tax=uncultured Chloroflexia bacterium TaxID=1672391 RepID=A0A6J4NWF3_9CHLR|nr:MAG: hypothetical protein AVDCRST_MAG93-10038 [uncultured Chloroflexia bacterium]
MESKLWPQEQKEIPWADIKRRAATDPSWVWHHPRALDDLKEEAIRRETWREIGDGYVERGPFPKPRTNVMFQELTRDPNTGVVTLRVKPLHADTVYYSYDGPATTSSSKLDAYDLETDALWISCLAVDSTGERETGQPQMWTNTLEVKYRLFRQGEERMCELRAIPSGDIRYTVDGSSLEISGHRYAQPFAVPDGTKLILAQAQGQNMVSRELRVEISDEDHDYVRIDASVPAIWRRRLERDSTAETYEFLEVVEKYSAVLGGLQINIGKESRWITFAADEQTFQSPAEVRQLASLFREVIPSGVVALTIEAMKFDQGGDLQEFAGELRASLEADEVEQ